MLSKLISIILLVLLGIGLVVSVTALLSGLSQKQTLQLSQIGPADSYPLTEPTAGPTPVSLQLKACGFNLEYPSILVPDGAGFQVRFEALDDPQTWLWLSLRPHDPSADAFELDKLGIALQLRYFLEPQRTEMIGLQINDAQNSTVNALQQDVFLDGEVTRLIVLVRPNALLGGEPRRDVVYEIVFHTRQNQWANWLPALETMLRQLSLSDCLDG